ncbi:regulatory protein RecX [bacterium]|nr:regulatory protein RecX [bacterium]
MTFKSKITKIEKQQKDDRRISVFLNEKFAFGICENTFFEFQLREGDFLTIEDTEKIILFDETQQAKKKALNILSKKYFSEQELKQKLKNFSEKAVEKVVFELKKYGYVDDKELAKRLVHDFVKIKGFGEFKIKIELQRRKINENLIEETLEEFYNEETEIDSAKKHFFKKLRSLKNPQDQKEKTKLYRYLLSKGFSTDTVNEIFNEQFRNE